MLDPANQYREVEFRDGKKFIPDYLVVLMSGLETHRMTYAEAVNTANKKAEADYLNAQRDNILAAHFREFR